MTSEHKPPHTADRWITEQAMDYRETATDCGLAPFDDVPEWKRGELLVDAEYEVCDRRFGPGCTSWGIGAILDDLYGAARQLTAEEWVTLYDHPDPVIALLDRLGFDDAGHLTRP